MVPQEHLKNRLAFPDEELRKHYGKFVAWTLDGRQIVASASDEGQLMDTVVASGIGSENVVLSYVPIPEEVIWGGALSPDGEAGR